MKSKNLFKFVYLLFLLSLFSSCSKIDKEKFLELYQASNDIEGAIKVGINYPDFSKLLQNFSSKKEFIDTTNLSVEEKKLFDLFDKLFTVYTHSHIIWDLETEVTSKYFPREFIRYEKIPIYKNEKVLMSITKLYDLEIENVKYEWHEGLTEEVDGINRSEAIRKIWDSSSKIFSEIKLIYNS